MRLKALNRVIEKPPKNARSFPTDELLPQRLIYWPFRSFEKTRQGRQRMGAARNQFAYLYPERFNK